MEFKDGDKVIVEKLYNLRLDGQAIFRGVCTDIKQNGYYKVENEMGHIMLVAPERVKKYE